MVKASTGLIDFTELAALDGVDGFVLFDPAGDVIQAKLEDNSQILELKQFLLSTIEAQKPFVDLKTQLLLTERGVIHIIRFEDSYLVVLAGHGQPVNVSKLTAIANRMGLKP